MFKIDLSVSVFGNLIGWYFYHHVGFRKGREGMLLREGQYCFIKCIGDIDVHNRMLNVFGVFSALLSRHQTLSNWSLQQYNEGAL
jgi:hypothetical protein